MFFFGAVERKCAGLVRSKAIRGGKIVRFFGAVERKCAGIVWRRAIRGGNKIVRFIAPCCVV
jgi:hypothetical protein